VNDVRRAIDSLPDPTVVVDGQGVVVLINAAAEELFGYARDELLGAAAESLWTQGNRGSASSGRPGPDRYGVRKDGLRFPIEVSLGPAGIDGRALVCATIRDLSDQWETDRVRLRLASIVESAQNAIISADVEGRIDSWNPAAERLFGYTAAEAIGRPAAFLKPPHLHGKSGDRVARLQRGDIVPASDTVRRTKDGRDIEVSITYSSIHDRDGALIGTSIVARDLTEQRRSDAVRFHLAAMIQYSGAAIIGYDLDTRVTSWNAAAEKLYGYTPAEALGRPGAFLVPPGGIENIEPYQTRLHSGATVPPYDAVRVRKDGSSIDVSISPSLIRDAAGAVVGYAAFVYDITERKQTERELAAAHEATLVASREYETFAYAVAHDLRAPLRGIDGFIHLGREAYEAGQTGEAVARLERASANVRQMGALIDGLLRLAQLSRQPIRRTTVDLSALVGVIVAQLSEESPDRVVVSDIEPGVSVLGDADLLRIVMTNLLDNAWKFTRHRRETQLEFGRTDGHCFVRDNGAGFDMAYYEKLFGMFQRLHHQSDFEGTGIGLATTQRIIRRHGGRIWAEGVLDQGSTFFFTLEPDVK
jgi:PAS domain S-box-containing protein